MSEFKVGDRIICTQTRAGTVFYSVGDTGTVIGLAEAMESADVRWDSDNHHPTSGDENVGDSWWIDFDEMAHLKGGLELFRETYDGESLYDLDRDVAEALMEEYNPKMSQVSQDEHGLHKGSFIVTIEWRDDDVRD
jgi:hypothetical protein